MYGVQPLLSAIISFWVLCTSVRKVASISDLSRLGVFAEHVRFLLLISSSSSMLFLSKLSSCFFNVLLCFSLDVLDTIDLMAFHFFQQDLLEFLLRCRLLSTVGHLYLCSSWSLYSELSGLPLFSFLTLHFAHSLVVGLISTTVGSSHQSCVLKVWYITMSSDNIIDIVSEFLRICLWLK